jgi:hypothetical protein
MPASRILFGDMRFLIFTAVKIRMVICWFMASCSLIGGYQRLEGTFCPHLHGRKRYLPILWNSPSKLYSIITKKPQYEYLTYLTWGHAVA